MAYEPSQAVILIPSLEPDARLPAYVELLLAKGFTRVLVVDDGSGEAYQPIFSSLAEMAGVTVLHHEVNRGKGCALKTGCAYIRDKMENVSGVITADADGQHTADDCWKLAQMLKSGEKKLYLGSRDFSLPNVPPKSRSGNKLTRRIFHLLYGQWLPDTQTGLRAFPVSMLQLMLDIPSERYEYEMQMLITCARAKIPMVPVPIETVYENNNEGTHFNPIRDSIRIYKVILGSFFKFSGASIASFLIDQGVFWVVEHLSFVARAVGNHDALILVATIVARLFSAPCNFLMNRNLVFKFKEHTALAAVKYAALCVVIFLLSSLGVSLLNRLGMPTALDNLSKLLVDTLLFLLSYRVQDKWIFAPSKEDKT